MPDESYLTQIVNALKAPFTGAQAATTPQVTLAPPLASYPSNEDAEYARKYGFGENSNEPFLNNQATRVLGFANKGIADLPVKLKKGQTPAAPVFIPESGAGRSLTNDLLTAADDPSRSSIVGPQTNVIGVPKPELQGKLDNVMMRAALAANRSPIAAAGFDPNKTVVDALIGQSTIGGAYLGSTDNIYSKPDDTIVHESTHRGLQKLREQYPDKMALLEKELPNEETVVRWLMHSAAGDPEAADPTAKAGLAQRQDAINMFGDTNRFGKKNRVALDKMQELAIEHMKNRGRRAGPQ